MHEPIGFSGVQTVPNSLQSVGFFAPLPVEVDPAAGKGETEQGDN